MKFKFVMTKIIIHFSSRPTTVSVAKAPHLGWLSEVGSAVWRSGTDGTIDSTADFSIAGANRSPYWRSKFT